MTADNREPTDPINNADPDARRKKLVWESLLGFVGFFTFMALCNAIWNILQPEPAIVPSIVLLLLLVVTALAWKGYSRYR
ncbi:hypothetical protein [Corynebacterium anserum]|uniref:Uncharacterized protein n=1 Tax=Corynebacterium anserum TaxID=2684406 RepID=A0A7G7YPR1_9CORY|nr:hypothetical protein [Corynebacterium anserum]QNH96481.1 hypothetical protein GP473_07270 [Corynebacterium anserum]